MSAILVLGSPTGSRGKGDQIPILVDSSGRPLVVATGSVAAGTADSGNPVKIGAVAYANTVQTAVADGQRANLVSNTIGHLAICAPIYSGTAGGDAQALQGFGGRDHATHATNPRPVAAGMFLLNGSTFDRATKPNATARLIASAATTNATSVKASAGNVHRIRGDNTAAAKKYLKLYNTASAPVVGTDTPVLTFALAASSLFDIDLGTFGHYFSTGIAYAITGAAADSDTTALASGDIAAMNITYS